MSTDIPAADSAKGHALIGTRRWQFGFEGKKTKGTKKENLSLIDQMADLFSTWGFSKKANGRFWPRE